MVFSRNIGGDVTMGRMRIEEGGHIIHLLLALPNLICLIEFG